MKIANEKGFTIGELLVVTALVLISLFAIGPLIQKVVQESDRVNCAQNLMELTRSMYIYAQEHNGKFPDDLKTLYEEEYIADKGYLDCPATEQRGTLEDPDYIYTPGLNTKMPQEACLLKDFEDNHSDGVNSMSTFGRLSWDKK